MISNNIKNLTNSTCIQVNETECYMYLEEKIANILIKYVPIALLIIGTIGNLLSFWVFLQKTLCDSVTSFYLRALALGDLVTLWSLTLPNILHSTIGINIIHLYFILCQLIYFICQTSMLLSVWILSTIAIERFVAVTFPHKLNIIFSHRRAYISIGVFLFLAIGLNIYVFFTYGSTNYTGGQFCMAVNVPLALCTSWAVISLYSFIPSVVITFCNVAIIYGVAKVGAHKRQQQTTLQKSAQTNMIAILLTISFAFMIFTLPTCLFFVLESASAFNIRSSGTRTWAQKWLTFIVCNLMIQMNHCLNFWLYVMSGTLFRNELRALLKYFLPKRDKSSSREKSKTSF